MCDPLTGALILTAVGGGTKAANQIIAGKRQDRAAAEGIRRQGELQRGANERVNEQIADIAGSTGAEERAASLEGFLNTLRDAQDVTGAAQDPLALGGQRFAERVGEGEAETRAKGVRDADVLSRIDAPLSQRQREAGELGETAVDLSELGRQSAAADFINQLRVASKRPNALVDALGSILQGAGSVVALKPGGLNLAKLAEQGTIVDPATITPFSPRVV